MKRTKKVYYYFFLQLFISVSLYYYIYITRFSFKNIEKSKIGLFKILIKC